MFIVNLVKKLTEHKVKFAIVGGYAVVLHGVTRGTVDIDIVISVDNKNFLKTELALVALGLKSRLPVTGQEVFDFRREYIEKRNLIAWSFLNPKDPTQVVDVIITHDLAKMSKVNMSLYGVSVPVLSKKFLIKMKRESGRPQDIEDVRALEELNEKS